MKNRAELHSKLEELLESKNVYYRKPSTIQYPAIVYSKTKIVNKSADDKKYHKTTAYKLTVISKRPDNVVIDKLLELPYCSYDTNYIADNLYHDVLTIYI